METNKFVVSRKNYGGGGGLNEKLPGSGRRSRESNFQLGEFPFFCSLLDYFCGTRNQLIAKLQNTMVRQHSRPVPTTSSGLIPDR
jgi:hypothetical protein